MPTAIVVRDLSVTFQGVKSIWQVLLQVVWIKRLVDALNIDSKQILKGISFEIPRGSIFGILGVNGAGKTTLINVITGLLTPHSGTITRADRLVVAKVQRGDQFSEFTAMQQIRFRAKWNSLPVRKAEQEALKLFRRFGVSHEDIAIKEFGMLSTGTKAKALLVFSLMPLIFADPDTPLLLVLDEPTLGFDVTASTQFAQIIKELREHYGDRLTIVFATHNPDEVSLFTDYICLSDGLIYDSKDGLVKFKEMVAQSGSIREHLTSMVTPTLADTKVSEHKEIEPASESTGPFSAIFYRSWVENKRSVLVTSLVVLSLTLPNVFPLFAATKDGLPGEIIFRTLVGIVVSLILRESFRVIHRERNYYYHLEMMLLSQVSLRKHLAAVTMQGLLVQLAYGLTTCFLLYAWLWLDPHYVNSISQVQSVIATHPLQLMLLFVLFIISACAIGSTTIMMPMLLESTQAYFILTILPLVTLACSGLYYEPHALPFGLSLAANLNPISYLADALRYTINGTTDSRLYLSPRLSTALPGIDVFSADILAALILSAAFGLIGWVLYSLIDPALRRTGRYCN